MIDSQDVQLQFVDDGTAHFEKSFVDHNVDSSNDKAYLKDIIGQGAQTEQEMYAQTEEAQFAKQQAELAKTRK